MVNAFKLSMRVNDDSQELKAAPIVNKELAWWEAGQIIIYPDSKVGLLWGVFKTLVIFMSLFTFTYSAAFIFAEMESFRGTELFFDIV
jgi:hypothetical protein